MSDSARLDPPDKVIDEALSSAHADDVVVIVEENFDADVRFANNTTTTNGVRRDRRVVIVAFNDRPQGRAIGVASASGIVDVVGLLRAAERDAAAASPADDAFALVDGQVDADFQEAAAETDLSVFSDLLDDLGAAFTRARAANRRLAGFAEHETSTTYLGSSTGLRRRHSEGSGSLQLVARSDDGLRSSWAGRGSATMRDVALLELEEALERRLSWAQRRIDLPAGRYEVIMPPDAVADLVIELAWAMGGQDAEDGGTVFSRQGGGTRRGERLFDEPFWLRSDPAYPGLECASFLATGSSSSDVSVFDNGARLDPVNWVEDGALARLRYHRPGAARSDELFTPPIDNLILELPGATASLDDLVADTERGLLLTCLWYIREVDPQSLLLTGLTRDGVYLVEHGQVVGAVNNFRFNESPVDLLRNATGVGRSERALSREWGEWMNKTSMPALRVADFNMSSVSPAN